MTPDRWRKIESIFEAAVDLHGGERDAYIESECGGDSELLREVSRLVASDDAAAGFIEQPVWTDPNFLNTGVKRAISDDLEDPKSSDFIGRQVGAYKLISEIGKGGMGAVFLAERADGEFSQKVAIKLIKRGMDSDFIIRRFRHERQILASFEHPYIARLIDGGTLPEGVPYFVMEYIDGQTLYNYADQRRLDLTARLKLFQKICSAIEYAHERQIVHRDIKPSNIVINGYGNPKLLDFGIAKVLDPDLIHESVNPTESLMRMMTPDYASPEQVQGEEVSASSDIYGLGVLLYEFLTGHRPYNFNGRALHEVTRVICEVCPPLPSRVVGMSDHLLSLYNGSDSNFATTRRTNTDDLKRTLTGGLDNILMKALSKPPADRYVSAKDFANDIGRYLSGKEVNARAPETAAATGVATRSLAVLPFRYISLSPEADTDDQFLGLGLADALITRLSKIRRFIVRPTNSIASFAEEPTDPIKAGQELSVDLILDGNIKKAKDRVRVTVQILNVKDNAAVWATSIDEDLADIFILEDTISSKLMEALLPHLTGSEIEEYNKRATSSPEAFEHYLRGRYYFNMFTEDGLAKSFVEFHRATAADENYAHAYSGIADYYNWLGILGVLSPQECFQPAIESASKAIALDDRLSEGHASLGFSLHAGNYDWEKAEFHLRRAIELNPGNAQAYVWYSIVLCTEGRFTDALEFARRGVELDPLTPFNHHNVGWLLYYARRYDEAIAQYKKVVADFPDYVFAHYGLSKIYRIIGQTQEAIKESDRTKELTGNSVFAQLAEAETLAAADQPDRARNAIANLESLSSTRYVSPYHVALAYTFLGDKETALLYLEKAAEIKDAWLNWLGVEPAFDPLRGHEKFESISLQFGYRGFLESSLAGVRRTGDPSPKPHVDHELQNMTTLVIDQGSDTAEALESTTAPNRSTALKAIYAVSGLAIVLLLIGVGFWARYNLSIFKPAYVRETDPKIKLQNPSLLILPFSSDEAANADLGIGMADALSNRLGNIKSLTVISSNTGRTLADSSDDKILAELGPTFIVRGKLSGQPGQMNLHAELTMPEIGKTIWTQDFVEAEDGFAGMQKRLSEKIWTSLGSDPMPLERKQIDKGFSNSNEAYQYYLIGRFQMTDRASENIRKAIGSFERSIEADPNFALGYVGLADAYCLINLYDVDPPKDAYEKARVAAEKALSLDDDMAEAHASLAYVKFYHQRDRAGAELEFRRAIQMNPSYAQAHHWFSLALAGMNRPVEAVDEAKIAQKLDPRSPSIKAATGIVYLFQRQNEQALAECDRALAISEGFVPALKVKRWVYEYTGDSASARDTFQKEISYAGGRPTDLGWRIVEHQLTSLSDGREKLVKELDSLVASDFVTQNPYTFAFEIALAYNHLGATDKALEWLERGEAANTHSMNFLAVDPRLDTLRDNPRFQRLIKKYSDNSKEKD